MSKDHMLLTFRRLLNDVLDAHYLYMKVRDCLQGGMNLYERRNLGRCTLDTLYRGTLFLSSDAMYDMDYTKAIGITIFANRVEVRYAVPHDTLMITNSIHSKINSLVNAYTYAVEVVRY